MRRAPLPSRLSAVRPERTTVSKIQPRRAPIAFIKQTPPKKKKVTWSPNDDEIGLKKRNCRKSIMQARPMKLKDDCPRRVLALRENSSPGLFRVVLSYLGGTDNPGNQEP
ncbi:hypothetical protein EVAR_54141_1 [Eumeta japonica]|uniref:Uncharacterized protein n=1 Tax=Eumeta variegata TaxID=151549 RepID=A0A4C1Z2Y8_EUMVA|nr:hypothetical protein EVAR_54141_1 [Eumeta japonica]